MHIQRIRDIARGRGLNPGRSGKVELILKRAQDGLFQPSYRSRAWR